MGTGCSTAAPQLNGGNAVAPDPSQLLSARCGRIYLSYHAPDTGDPSEEPAPAPGGPGRGPPKPASSAKALLHDSTAGYDGAAPRVAAWLRSRGFEVLLGEPDVEVRAAGVQSGLQRTWVQRMEHGVESCAAFVALCSERYGTGTEARRELQHAGGLADVAVLPLWHSGPWPPPALEAQLQHLARVPKGPRPLSRTVADGVYGELLERLQEAGCAPGAPQAGAAAAAGSVGGKKPAAGAQAAEAAPGEVVGPAPPLDPCFLPGPEDPKPEEYSVVSCYTGTLQELVDRLALVVRPTVLDMGGGNFQGPLPPGCGDALRITPRHVTLRNGALLLDPGQTLLLAGHGCVLDTVSVLMSAGARRGAARAGGGGGGGDGAHVPPWGLPPGQAAEAAAAQAGQGQENLVVGQAFQGGRGMVTVAGAVGVRLLNCTLVNHGPHITLWLTHGATAALNKTTVEAGQGAGAVVRDAGSVLVAKGSFFHKCSGPCLLLEAGGAAQLEECSVGESSRHNALAAASGATLRADRCTLSDSQVGLLLYAGASAQLLGCEVSGNTLAGIEVREPGSSLAARDCRLARNSQAGLLVGDGGAVQLFGCSASGNTTHGVLVRSGGAAARLHKSTCNFNNQAGALVSDGGRLELSECEAQGNKMCGLIVWGQGTSALASDTRLMLNAQAGLAVKQGGQVELVRCMVKGNKVDSELSGAGTQLTTCACLIDHKPLAVSGAVVQDVSPAARAKQQAAKQAR